MEHVKSLLPAGKQWKLVWNDEFDGTELDLSLIHISEPTRPY